MASPLISMTDIGKHYTLGPDVVTHVLKSVSFTVDEGESLAIMGPSGSGKSTLLNLLGTLDVPSTGEYMLDGENIGAQNDASLAAIRNRTIGFVFQGFNLLSRRTVLDNIMLPMFYAGKSRAECITQAEHYLAKVGLMTHRDYLPTQLSGGQQQRVAIARALASSPKMILADEPTGNLDSKTSKDIMTLFSELNAQGITVILVTHDESVARHSKRLLQIKDGEVIYDGPMY